MPLFRSNVQNSRSADRWALVLTRLDKLALKTRRRRCFGVAADLC